MKAGAVLLNAYAETDPADLARACETLDPAGTAAALGELSPRAATAVLQAMSPPAAARALAACSSGTAATLLPTLPTGLLANLLRRIDAKTAEHLIDFLTARGAESVRRQLNSPDGTAGAIMDTEAPAINVNATVADAQAVVRSGPAPGDAIFVVDDTHAVVGLVDTAVLALEAPEIPIRSFMRSAPSPVPIEVPLVTLAALPEWRNTDTLAVVDEQRRFAGVLRHRRIRQAAPDAGSDRTMRTLMALGEVYWLGLSGLMQGLATSASAQSGRGEGVRL